MKATVAGVLWLGIVAIVTCGCNEDPTQPPCVPALLDPPAGAVLDNGCFDHSDPKSWSFDWTACPDHNQYRILVQGSNATVPLIDRTTRSDQYHFTGYGWIHDDNRLGWTWKVRAQVGGRWGAWSEEREFDVGPRDTDCPRAGDPRMRPESRPRRVRNHGQTTPVLGPSEPVPMFSPAGQSFSTRMR